MAFPRSVGTRARPAGIILLENSGKSSVSFSVEFLRRPIVDLAGGGGGETTLFKQTQTDRPNDIARWVGGPNQRNPVGFEGPSLIFRNGHVASNQFFQQLNQSLNQVYT